MNRKELRICDPLSGVGRVEAEGERETEAEPQTEGQRDRERRSEEP